MEVESAADKLANDASARKAALKFTAPPPYFNEALEDAERLLKYTAEFGIEISAEIRDHVLEARSAHENGWTEETAGNLLEALARLSARLKPVTAESLRACNVSTRATVRTYWKVSVCLAVVIIPFSLASFVGSAISNTMRADIATANDMAVKLRAQLGPPGSPPATSRSDTDAEITELQLFASTNRAIDARARQLRVLVFFAERDPFKDIRGDTKKLHDKFQLPDGLPDLPKAAADLTAVYQDVRYFGQSLLDDVSFSYGAITVCLLPVLYALLGTCAYLLRTFEQQMTARTFTPSVANSARFLVAAIGGAVVGLFNNFTVGQGASIPPLAIAFLVGYAVDVFFTFLEGLLQVFTKKGPSAPQPPPLDAKIT